MTVEFNPKDTSCFSFGVSNQTWFTVLKETEVGDVLGRVYANNEINATEKQALKCAEALKGWTPPLGWYYSYDPESDELLSTMICFFEACKGFTTH